MKMQFPPNITLKTLFPTCALLFFVISCNQKKNNDGEQIYQAINKTDTAVLNVTKIDNKFYGIYQIIHSNQEKDSGVVNGTISGDTLQGSFLYAPYYNREELKRKPVAFLERDGKLLIGKGSVSVYMGIPFFSPDVPIKYTDPEFIFEKLTTE